MQSTWIVVKARRVGVLVGATFSTLSLIAIVAVTGHRSGHMSAMTPALETIPASARAVGADASWWQTITDNLTRAEYAANPTAGGFQAPNRAQNLRTTFGERGIEVAPRTENEVALESRFTWQTTGIGRSDRMEEVSPASPEAEGSRVTYRRNGWSEWYENTAKGLEQGFTIDEQPAGEGPLRIAGRFPEGLRAEVKSDGAIDFMDAHGARVIRYGELHVWDARGTEMPSELELEGTTLGIAIDDRDAEYPLLVDPLMTSPAWTAELNQPNAAFGISVATAGDVNGDGYSDVIVGAQFYDHGTGQTDEGGAFVYHGSASGLSVTPNWTGEGDQANAFFGYSVATAGDVNGDGYSDVIVGAFFFTNGQNSEGRAYVYHGSPSGLSLTPNWTAESNQPGAQFGTSVATAGDVNGDGFSDVIVGARFFDNGHSDEGGAFVYHGSAGGLSLTPNWSGEGNLTGVQFGVSVATAGDVNADGLSDVVVGAWRYTNGQANEGRAFAYHGSAGGLSLTSNWSAEGNLANAAFGISVAGVGDVNGDGYADVVVGAQGFSNGQSAEGAAFVYHGSASGLSVSPNWTAESNLADASLGNSVATAGDVNGDGFADVIVGASNYTNQQFTEGEAYVYQGSASGLSLAPDWSAESNLANANFGISVATAGDVNGDGFGDVIVGAQGFTNGQSAEGRAFVYHGAVGGMVITYQWDVSGNQEDANFGWSVATAGDVNGDGYSDVIVGAPQFDNPQGQEGLAFVFPGSEGGLSFVPNWTAESNQPGAEFGYSVAAAGDVNGDGFADVIIGARFYSNGQVGEGRAYVYRGSAAGLSDAPHWNVEGDLPGARLGWSVATAGDVNGDGYSDVVVGAPRFSNGDVDEGQARVYHGSASGLSLTPDWTAEGDQANAFFGTSVATAGDVNGDGYSDVIVGAIEADQTNPGRAYVYLGSAAGLASSAAWIPEGDQADANFGWSVATAGDVNGDGYSDVIVGAPLFDNPESNVGLACVYRGSAGGLSLTPDWTREGPRANAYLGSSVATAGDVNGDGYSDVIIAAPAWNTGGVSSGRAFIYRGSAAGLSTVPDWHDQGFALAVATAGDVDGDGYSDVIVGAFDSGIFTGGGALVFLGIVPRGLDRVPRQARADDSAPISLLGMSDSPTSFLLKALGRTAAGRGRVQVQFEVEPFGVPFDGSGVATGALFDTGAPSQGVGSAVHISGLANGLVPEALYHWRLRIAADSPFFPRTPWLTHSGNNVTEADLRTAAAQSGVGEQEAPGAQLPLLEAVRPNPIVGQAEIAYTLREASEVRLTVVDVSGRVRAVVTKETQVAGRHSTRWDGRDREGRALPAGVYLVRLEVANQVISRKLVIAR